MNFKEFAQQLYEKRNLMVHEYQIESITQLDRTLSKYIAERLMLFLIDPPIKVNNIEECRIVLDNALLPENKLTLKKKLISKLIRQKTRTNP